MESLQRFYQKKRVLVTGGAGFIGSHLVEKLVALGAVVTVMDNFSTGQLNNLKSVVHAINLLYADVRAAYSCIKATARQDVVFHLASFISVPESIKHPEVCYSVNVQGTNNMLDSCQKNNVQTFIFSSSSAVYGQKQDACSETDKLDPLSPYAESKLAGEAACKKYAQEYAMSTAMLRYFNVYGERQNPNGQYAAVVAKFKQQLLKGEPVTIFGDGKQTRDFVNVAQVVEANLLLGTKANLKGEVFNVGSGKSLTLLELLAQLEGELKVKRAGVSFLPARQGDILHSQADCAKFKSLV